LNEWGVYDFSIYCPDTFRASLRFEVATAGSVPPTLLRLVSSVDETVQQIAIDSVSFKQLSTTTDVPTSKSVRVTWTAYNVAAGSCTLNGAPQGEVGSAVLAGLTDQIFQCQDTRGRPYTVTAKFRSVP
jgi:hypothetical protein